MSRAKWLPWVVVVAILLLSIGGVVAYKLTRGIRNNNPGNIRKSKDAWKGLAPAADQTDPEFFRFLRPEDGIRALAVTLKTYQRNYAADTVEEIITRWAPPSENNTGAYIRSVSAKLGKAPTTVLSYPADLAPLVAAIIAHENSGYQYPDDTLRAGIALA